MLIKLVSKLAHWVYQKPRIIKYRLLSTCRHVSGRFTRNQPVIFHGKGEVSFTGGGKLGYRFSPGFYEGVIYIEARNPESKIHFGKDVRINNNVTFVSEGEGIHIGQNVFIGMHCLFIDTDGHPLSVDARNSLQTPSTAPIIIGDNVFIGSNVTVLKGVTIGNNTVVAAGSLVTKSLPENTVCGGNPANVLRTLS